VRKALFLVLLILTACAPARRYRVPRVPKPGVSAITDAALTFIFFDLGQADGMLVKYGDKTLLMDAGESREPADKFRFRGIAKTLEAMTGKRHLDYFVVSHYHQDHVGDPRDGTGIFGLLAEDGVTVGTAIDRGFETYGEKGKTQLAWERSLPAWLASGKVGAHRAVKIGDSLDLGEGLTIAVVAANGAGMLDVLQKQNPDELAAFPPSENDYSVALKFTYGDFELYAGGDLSGSTIHRDFPGGKREGYHDIESLTAERVGDVEVYRANHHGSRHSSSGCWVNVLHPEVTVISSGENNYGHPTEKVYDKLSDMGRVFITGGADFKVKQHVSRSIVGGDIPVRVEKGGARYSVNGNDFKSLTEAEEAARGVEAGICRAGAKLINLQGGD
jgi:hypothetical protein